AGANPLTWLTTKVPLSNADNVLAVVTVSLNITEQKETQRLNTLLATAVEHAGDAIEITDCNARFQYVNSAFERISGYRRDEALGETPFTLLMGNEANMPYYQEVQKCISEGRIWHGTLKGRRKDGTIYQQEA